VGLFSKFLWKLRLFRAVSEGGPYSLRERRRDVFREASVDGYRDFGVLSGNGWLGTADLGLCGCGLGMLLVRPRNALSLLLGR
jgi:hypothetical protein